MLGVHRWLAAIVESSDDAIIGKDLNGKIISCNHGASELYGYSREELVGKPITILTPPDLQDEEKKIYDRLRQGGKLEHYETVRRRKDGTLIPVSLTISPIRDARGKLSALQISPAISPNGKTTNRNWRKAWPAKKPPTAPKTIFWRRSRTNCARH